jgi:DNA mismatch endonuclease, patch repair protein
LLQGSKIDFGRTSRKWKKKNTITPSWSMPSPRSSPPPASDAATAHRMRHIRQRQTKPEELVASALRSAGLGYRRNVRSLPGSPDFANRKGRWAVFVHGCFWHHHTGCHRGTMPKRNDVFWREKFRANRTRDARSIQRLRRLGFKVLLIWECETADLGDRLSQRLTRERTSTN